MSDRIVLRAMEFDGHHGVSDLERSVAQPFEVDVELGLDLAPAGRADDLALTVDYGALYDLVSDIVEMSSLQLLETIAESIARSALDAFPVVDEVAVRVRKMRPPIDGRMAWAGVEVRRARDEARPPA
jgi:dihydroneopterin aldolase